MVELLIVIGLLTILATVVVPNFASFQNQKSLDNAAFQLKGYFQSTQQKSISQDGGSQWGIYLATVAGGRDFYKIFYGASYLSGTVTDSVYLPPKIKFINPAQGFSKEIIFSKLIGIPSAPATTSLAISGSPSVCKTIVINAAGLISSVLCP
ncbi:MAG: Uncharacterized protein Athens101426_436 [Parcubacteria group bacterium Athens1014_26]|nr:MAG: Uncharacterized protein Athens101426_436 [Parcubacteria group bacterium Athens1014_26]